MSGATSDPVRRAFWLDALEQQLRPLLPPPLADHCRLANVSSGRLVFLVDSPVWRAKLRLAAPELVNLAQSIGLDVAEAVVRIVAPPAIPGPAARKATPITAASRKALEAALASLDDPDSAGPEDCSKPPSRHR